MESPAPQSASLVHTREPFARSVKRWLADHDPGGIDTTR